MDITTETLQAFLDDAWDAAPAGANTLRDQLRAFEKQVTALFRQGSIAVVSKNSASQTYRGPGLGSYTPVQIANAWRSLINLYDEVKARLDCKAEDDSDPTVYDKMRCRLRLITEYSPDLTELRTGTICGPVSWA